MDQAGLWELFFRTGLPQVWLVIRARRGESGPAAAAMAPGKERPASG